MNVVVDTLKSEVRSYTSRAYENTSFSHLYGEAKTQPFISNSDLNFQPDTVTQFIPEKEFQTSVPDFFVFQFLEKRA